MSLGISHTPKGRCERLFGLQPLSQLSFHLTASRSSDMKGLAPSCAAAAAFFIRRQEGCSSRKGFDNVVSMVHQGTMSRVARFCLPALQLKMDSARHRSQKDDLQLLHEQKAGSYPRKASDRPRITCCPNPDNAKIPAVPATYMQHRHGNHVVRPTSRHIPADFHRGWQQKRPFVGATSLVVLAVLVSQFEACCGSYRGVAWWAGRGRLVKVSRVRFC